ncbi:MAG: hypothetical protein ABIH90_02145 [Candidatus Aenigmatarchaeota archaeon]
MGPTEDDIQSAGEQPADVVLTEAKPGTTVTIKLDITEPDAGARRLGNVEAGVEGRTMDRSWFPAKGHLVVVTQKT